MNAEYQRLQDAARELDQKINQLENESLPTSAAELTQFETRMTDLCIQRRSIRTAMVLLRAVASPKLKKLEQKLIAGLPKKLHAHGTRTKKVQLAGGISVSLNVTYYHPQRDPDRKSKHPRRARFPMLMILGISEGLTPHARHRIVRASTLLGSFDEASSMLVAEGLQFSINQLRKVITAAGPILSRLTEEKKLLASGNVKDRRIAVSLDGGRVRLREPRRGRTKKGRKKFAANWREPRLFIIYAVDENGRMAKDFAPVIDGTMGSPDRLLEMIQACLVGLRITEASRVLFVADGATWIWKRIPKLISALKLKDKQAQQLIDFWHAVEYLGKIATSRKLSGKERQRWLTTQKKRLLRGEIGTVVDEIRTLLGAHRTKDQRTWLNYFVTHGLTHRRMDYSHSRDHQMPIGSGAIESAVRRVINLRVKSNSVYWLRENAETMIRYRAWLKAGRAEELFHLTTCVDNLTAI